VASFNLSTGVARLEYVTTSMNRRGGWVSDVGDVGDAASGAPEPHQNGFDEFFRRNWLAMVRLAGLLVDDVASAEDVAQDAFVSYQRHRDSLHSADADVAYLRKCVINGARSVVRRRIVSRRHAELATDLVVESPDTAVLACAANSDVMAVIRRLPRRQREVLILRYWVDLRHAEIARLLGVSESTAKSTASRALDALEQLLEETR
jgi:RNA polymerase sigma-70 factor (sigma-E family)